ncbi:MAG: hypothetical protein ACYCZC_02890 [Acidithiobacillus sp.]
MLQQLSAGLALALFTLMLPNSTNFAQPDLPLHLLQKVEASANDPQWGGDGRPRDGGRCIHRPIH